MLSPDSNAHLTNNKSATWKKIYQFVTYLDVFDTLYYNIRVH